MRTPLLEPVPPVAGPFGSPAAAQVPADLLHRLVRSLTPELILLFGSRARGTSRPASDIDLLLIGPWTMEPAQLLRHARHLITRSFPRVDLVLCAPDQIAAAEAGRAPFLRTILDSGVVIYRR